MTSTARFLRFTVAALGLSAAAVSAVLALTAPERAPAIAYTLLDGSRHHSDALRGKVVLVNFWATSCTSCIKEMPLLAANHRKFASRGFETLAVAMHYDPPAYVVNYAQSRQLPFPVVIDNTGEIARRYGKVQVTPTTFVLDKKGRIAHRYVGPPDAAHLDALISRLLAQG